MLNNIANALDVLDERTKQLGERVTRLEKAATILADIVESLSEDALERARIKLEKVAGEGAKVI